MNIFLNSGTMEFFEDYHFLCRTGNRVFGGKGKRKTHWLLLYGRVTVGWGSLLLEEETLFGGKD